MMTENVESHGEEDFSFPKLVTAANDDIDDRSTWQVRVVVVGGSEDEEERMDRLWERFNDEFLLPQAVISRERAGKVCARCGNGRWREHGSVLLVLRVLGKLFLLRNITRSTGKRVCR